jgi:hypothetical protein
MVVHKTIVIRMPFRHVCDKSARAERSEASILNISRVVKRYITIVAYTTYFIYDQQ